MADEFDHKRKREKENKTGNVRLFGLEATTYHVIGGPSLPTHPTVS